MAGNKDQDVDAVDEIQADIAALFDDLDTAGVAITGRILRLSQRIEARREAALAPYQLTVADFDVLATLRRKATEHPIKVRELQASLMLSSGGMTKRLDRLEQAGHIQRHPDPNDRRGVLIALPNAGRLVIDQALPAVLEAERDLVHSAIGNKSRRSTLENELRALTLAAD